MTLFDKRCYLSNLFSSLWQPKNLLAQIFSWTHLRTDIYMVFTTEGFLEVAIESWPEWDLNPRPLNSVQML